jgi:hypothetical protein
MRSPDEVFAAATRECRIAALRTDRLHAFGARGFRRREPAELAGLHLR